MKTWLRTAASLGATLMICSVFSVAQAANPRSGRVDPTHRQLSWSGGPLAGSAPAFRRVTCQNPASCDRFDLDVSLPASIAPKGQVPALDISLATDAPNQVNLLVYRPGSDPADPSNQDYSLYPTGATLISPRTGTWHIIASCYECAGATYTITAKVVTMTTGGATPIAFAGKQLPTGGAGEPGIEVGPHDEIWVNANGGGQFWSSYDNGNTFQYHFPDNGPWGAGDTWATIGSDGTVYLDELEAAPPTDFIFVTKDHGKTYTNPALPDAAAQQAGFTYVPYAAGVDADREWFTADPHIPGTVYFERHDLGDPVIQTYKSTDYGATWIPMGIVNLDELKGGGTDSLGGNVTGPIEFAPDGTMAFPIGTSTLVKGTTASPTNTDFEITKIYVATSSDKGQTWSVHNAVNRDGVAHVDHGRYPAVWDKAGNLYVAYSERLLDDTKTTMYLVTSKDKGATWSAPIKVSDSAGSNIFPAIAAKGLAGNVDVAWLESSANDFNDSRATWRVVMVQSFNALDAKPTFTKYQLSSGIVHNGDVCQAGTLCAVTGGNRNLLDYIWMDADSHGCAHVVWTNDISGETKTEYAKQIGGTCTTAKPRTSAVLGKRVTKPVAKPTVKGGRLPSTGVGTGLFGVALLAIAGVLGRRLRVTLR